MKRRVQSYSMIGLNTMVIFILWRDIGRQVTGELKEVLWARFDSIKHDAQLFISETVRKSNEEA